VDDPNRALDANAELPIHELVPQKGPD
jgi:hypothetical protein